MKVIMQLSDHSPAIHISCFLLDVEKERILLTMDQGRIDGMIVKENLLSNSIQRE